MSPCFLRKANTLLKGSCPMMFELLLDVMDRFLNLRESNPECAIALLPSKVSEVWKGLMNPSRSKRCRTPAPIRPCPTGRLLRGGAFPGTSCQATIVPSLRDISQQSLASLGNDSDASKGHALPRQANLII